MWKLVPSIVLLVLCACTTTQETARALHSRWDGKSVDSFFVRYGPPVSSYTMNDGGRIFTWEGGKDSITIAGVSTTSTSLAGRTAISTTNTTPSTEIKMGCRVQIVADKAGIVQEIRPTGDTMGAWQLSRCAEVFEIS